MPALDTLYNKNIFHDDLETSRMRSYLHNFIDSMEGRREVGPPELQALSFPGTFRKDANGDDWADMMLNTLSVCENYYVDPRMHALITAASESMPSEVLRHEDLPSDQGWLWVPGGIGYIDVRGRPLKCNAILWHRLGERVEIVWLTDKYDPEDAMNMQYGHDFEAQGMPRFTPSHTGTMMIGHELPKTFGPDFLVPPEMKIQILKDEKTGQYGWMVPEGYEDLAEKFGMKVRPDNLCRWLLTTWRLMQQTIVDVREEEPNRQFKRQMERKNRPDQKVSVIALRSQKKAAEGVGDIEWTHRWLVKGHWRNQPYKGENGETVYRYIWIHPHVKGPENAPLLIREHVYALVR
jgi:hypothetical protein